ncbi:MAG: hypothetical protein KH366_05500, partial [Clostridiaceae bacterium]|nr:hypothetical protein [Clostridiaceae bacterium]
MGPDGRAESGGDENRLPTVRDTKAAGMEKDGPMPNRVGGWPLVGQPTSHTTVHAGPHTAV